jgi:DNA-binding FadR family transcriptional regulator
MTLYGVSRTAVREAMKTLSAKGLLESKVKVGTRVLDESRWQMFDPDILAWRLETGLDSHFIASLFEIRQTIEPAAAALAAVRRTEADLARIRAALADMARTGHDVHLHAEADLIFHLAVVAASHNPLMRSIGAVIETALIAAFTHSSPVRDPDLFARSLHDHGLIAAAIERRDPEAASGATAAVILGGARFSGYPDNVPPLTAIAVKALLTAGDTVGDRNRTAAAAVPR